MTIFASSGDVKGLLDVVSMNERDFEGSMAHHGVTTVKYVYFVVGSVSSGKSTIIRNLRDLETIEEWPVSMPPVMNRPSVGLAQKDQQEIDKGLEEAIYKKNQDVRDIKSGIVAVDRAPLDFIAFPTESQETISDTARQRTTSVLNRLEAGNFQNLCAGQVIVVQTENEILLERQIQRGRPTATEDVKSGKAMQYLENQQKRLEQIYKSAMEDGSVVKTDRGSVAASVKAAARIVHFEEYKPFDFVKRLTEIKGGK